MKYFFQLWCQKVTIPDGGVGNCFYPPPKGMSLDNFGGLTIAKRGGGKQKKTPNQGKNSRVENQVPPPVSPHNPPTGANTFVVLERDVAPRASPVGHTAPEIDEVDHHATVGVDVQAEIVGLHAEVRVPHRMERLQNGGIASGESVGHWNTFFPAGERLIKILSQKLPVGPENPDSNVDRMSTLKLY